LLERLTELVKRLTIRRKVGIAATTLGHGDVLDGRFAIKRLLGMGGTSAVYVAEQRSMGRDVALKVLRSELFTREQATERFVRESRAVSRLTSPHTISVYDVGRSSEGLLYIAMELLKGRSLFQQITEEHGPMSLWRAVNIVDQVLDSLDEAHGAGVLHRDLKPENIFVIQGAGATEFAKVLDFGIAELADDPSSRDSETGLVTGTPRYMSPEQMEGKELDARTDLYSLATILFELLSGKPPFEAGKPVALAIMKIRKDPPSIEEISPLVKVPPEIEQFIARALSRNPEDRPVDASEFKNLLTLAMEGVEKGDGEEDRSDPMVVLGVPQPRPDPRDEPAVEREPAPGTPQQPDKAKPHSHDRRGDDRQRRTVATRFQYQGNEYRATTTDIGIGGAFLFSRLLPSVGQLLEFVFVNPGHESFMIHLTGEVIRVMEKPSEPGQVRGFAVRWVFPGTSKRPKTLEELFSSG